MPRNVRNFWIKTQVDGRAEEIRCSCSPKSAGGGFVQNIYMRDKGSVTHVVTITGVYEHTTGKLVLNVDFIGKGSVVLKTSRDA